MNSKRELKSTMKPENKRSKLTKPNSLKEEIVDSSILEDQVEYVDEDSENDCLKSENQRKKEMREMEEEFSGDEEDFEEMKRSERTLKHLGAEANYETERDQSIFLTKNDLLNDVSGITPFNLKEENEEGRFDANGDYHAKKNKDEEDIELDVYTRDMYKEGLAKVPVSKDENVLSKSLSQNMQIVRLCSFLQPEEVPRDAIQRFGKILNPKKPKSKRHMMAFEKEDEHIATPEEVSFYKQMIESVTECCSSLLDEFPSIYEMKKEDLARLVIMNYSTSQKQWEYKWQVKEDGSVGESEVYGVFNTAQMIEWHEAGCFASNPLIRQVEKKKESEKGFTGVDFDAAFDADSDTEEQTATTNPWIAANEIDYFTD